MNAMQTINNAIEYLNFHRDDYEESALDEAIQILVKLYNEVWNLDDWRDMWYIRG